MHAACNMFKILRREYVVEQYLRAGAQFGESVVALFAGECSDVETRRGLDGINSPEQ